jgi:uncharacterized membrane protein
MEKIDKSIDIDVPVSTVFNQWTQFEEFPFFMESIKHIRQIDDTHVHWEASIAGKQKQWDAEIVEQIPDHKISWRSTTGTPNNGELRFESIESGGTRLWLHLEYEPESVLEEIGDKLGFVSKRVEDDLQRFKEYIENRRRESGAWRGYIHHGETIRDNGGSL